MTDRELLELAAKAAGLEIDESASRHLIQQRGNDCVIFNEMGGHSVWNPIEDDGDALRLLHAIYRIPHVNAWVRAYDNLWARSLSDTRRAIVRAAAEIGKGK